MASWRCPLLPHFRDVGAGLPFVLGGPSAYYYYHHVDTRMGYAPVHYGATTLLLRTTASTLAGPVSAS
jgi:hypothetical protein